MARRAGRLAAWLASRPALVRRVFVASVQGALVLLSAYLAFYIRFEGSIPESQLFLLGAALPVLFVLRMAAFVPFGLFEGLWRYASAKDIRNIAGSVALGSLAFLVVERRIPGLEGYSRSVLVIDSLLLGSFLSAVRLARLILRGVLPKPGRRARVLIVGAGDAGEALLREIELHPEYGYVAAGLVDDDPAKRGTKIRGVKIYGSRRELRRIVEKTRAEGILIAIPSASPERLREIAADCRRTGLGVKTLPGFGDLLLSGRLLDAVVDVEPEDLLCRPPVAAILPEVESSYRGKKVLVTGAGGSIGGELSRQLSALGVSRLVLFERHEFGLYAIDRELRERRGPSVHVPVIGDVCDRARFSRILEEHAPEIVFHAAAYKHVPLMEANPTEAVKVNVLGTKNAVELALERGVERFVFISSDKAVDPAGVMGATKKLGELILERHSRGGGNGASRTRFVTVRFGNVLESSGSVVPLFKEQIRVGGPVTVTDPRMERYFMTTREAVHLVLCAAMLGEGGEVFVLDMGEPIKLVDLAKQLISLYGYEPERDIPIVFTGLRPGERLKESLFDADEEPRPTRHPKLRVAALRASAARRGYEAVRAILAPYLDGMLSEEDVAGDGPRRPGCGSGLEAAGVPESTVSRN